jgi:selenocysteine-specific elongation factor
MVLRREGAALAFSREHWQALQQRALAGLGDFHARFAGEIGPERQRLRRMVAPWIAPAAWNAAIEELAARGRIALQGPWLRLPSHRTALSAAERVLAQKIVPMLEAAEFDPPWVRDIARQLHVPEADVRSLMLRLVREGLLFQVVHDLFYPSRTVVRLARIAAELQDAAGMTAAHFRDRTGLGRKRAIQILEFFDRVGYTRRVKGEHRLRGGNPFGERQSAALH